MSWNNYQGGASKQDPWASYNANRQEDDSWAGDGHGQDDAWGSYQRNGRGQDDAWGGYQRNGRGQDDRSRQDDGWAGHKQNGRGQDDAWSGYQRNGRGQDDRNRQDDGWAGHQQNEEVDPWAAYLRDRGQDDRSRQDTWSSRGQQSKNKASSWQDDSWNHTGGTQDDSWQSQSWGQDRGSSSRHKDSRHEDDSWQSQSWGQDRGSSSRHKDSRHEDDSWQSHSWGQDRGNSSRHQDDSWQSHSWGQDKDRGSSSRHRNSHHEDRNSWNSGEDSRARHGGANHEPNAWSDWEKPHHNQESSGSGNWNRRNRSQDEASDPWANWQSQSDGQDTWGGATGSKDKDWDGVNRWATQLLEQDEVDWTTRPTVDVKKDFSQELGHHNSRSKEEIEEMRQRSGIEILDGDSEEHPVPGLIDNFDEACWPQEVQQALVAEGFEEPTPIQKQIWPIATKGRDVVGIAETGSGKTVSYVLPMITHIRNQAQPLEAGDGPVGLVLAPTRELARQILRVCERYGGLHDMKSTTIVGGTKIDAQKQMLQEQNHIIVATPGRFLQALGDEWTTLNRCTFVVLDEADELLKKEGFEYDIRAIMTQVRKERQVLMFSATWPEDVQNLAGEICTAKDDGPPVHVRIGGNRLAACKNVVQRAEIVDGDDAKYERLKEKLQEMNIFRCAATPEDEWPDKCIIFCRSRAGVQSLKDKLWQEDFCYNENNDLLVNELHGDMLQKDRDWAMEQFRDGSLPCVIATGVLARGHDIPKVRYVINYDMPKMAEDYIHRVGRTGRAGNTGYAFTFVNRSNWKDLQWGHEYLLGVLEATKQDVDATLKDVIDNHANQAEWQNDQYDNDQSWEDAANWNVGSSAKEAYVASLDDDLNAVQPEHQARKILGEYAEQGSFYGCKVYQRTECQDDGSTLHLYYYGEEGESKGWYIGPALGGDIVYACAGESHDPPEGGWHFFSLEAQEFEPLNAFKIVKKTAVQGWFDETHEGSREAGQGQSSTDAWQEAPGMPTSTEAYSVEVVWTKEPTNGLNVNAEEFKMEAEWHYDSAQGVYQGELPPEMVAEAYAQQEDAGNAAWPQGYEAMDPAAAYYPSDACPTDMSSQAFDYNAQAFYQAQEHYYGPGAEEASWAANTTTMEATGNGSRPPPGLEEERNLTGAVVVDAEPFVLADDEVAVQADQECSPAEFFDPDAEERTCTGLVDPEEEEQAGADAGDEPATEDLHHRVLAQMLQAPEVEPLAEEAAEPTAEEAPAVESTAKNAESAEPDTDKAVDQPMAHQEWNGFWENKDEPASEAQAVPESCPVYSIDKDPKVEVDPGVAAEVEEAPENAAAVSSEIEGKMEAAPENAAAAAAVGIELDGKMVEAPENAAAEIECKMAEAPENAAAAAVSSVIDGKMEEALENAAADVSSELDGKMVETPENAAAVSSEIDGKMAEDRQAPENAAAKIDGKMPEEPAVPATADADPEDC